MPANVTQAEGPARTKGRLQRAKPAALGSTQSTAKTRSDGHLSTGPGFKA